MHVQHQQVDTEMDPLLAEVNKLINDLSFEPALPLTRSEFTDVSLDTIRLMARADDFIKDGIFKDMVPEFIDRTTKTYHGECDGLHKALQTLKADAAMYA